MAVEDQDLKRSLGLTGETIERPSEAVPPKPAPKARISWLKKNRRLVILGAVVLGMLIALAVFLPKLLNRGSDLITATVERGDIETAVTALGTIQPKNYVDVGAQVSGQIKALHVDIGDTVKKGDLLVEIDAQVQAARVAADKDNLISLQAQLVDQQAQLLLRKIQYERQVRLDREGATSKAELQTAKAAYDSATAQIQASEAQIRQSQSSLQADEATLSYATIVAPMDGTVVSLAARLGQTLNSVQSAPILLRIADLSLMEIWTQVSEADVAKLKPGMPVYFTTLGNPARRYDSTLAQILPTPETVNNVILYNALFDAPNPDGSLMTQMTAQGFFVTASAKDVLLVPAAAVKPLGARAGRARGKDGQGRRGASAAGKDGAVAEQAQGARAERGERRRTRAGSDGAQGATPTATTTTTTTNTATTDGEAGAGRGPRGDRAAFRATHGTVEVIGPGGKIEQRTVETGVTDRVNTEIKSGLKEGETVVAGKKLPASQSTGGQGQRQGGRSPLQGFGPPGGGGGGRGFR